MFRNELSLLKAENKKQLDKLSFEEQKIIKDITRSINIFKVNSYDAQVIKRDLIGMAQELKLRDSSLNDAIGDNLKDFTNELIESSNGPSKTEIILKFLSKASGYFLGWFLLSAFLQYGSMTWEANPVIFIFYTGMVIISFISEGIATPIFATERGSKSGFDSLLALLMFVGWAVITYLLIDRQNTIKINGGFIIVVSGVVFMITKFLNIKNIAKLAKEKENYISDLK